MRTNSKIPLLRPVNIMTAPLLLSQMFFKVSDNMAYANSVDPDQTAPSGAV